ncbi:MULTISPECIES: urea carboxylase-associated family protein [Rhodomicrobium]|uniref:DUF1989 domain-containing protein n=1 Tax=Rhodomicrobium TaxID=1068 RepID=UPI000B4AB80B|nr:MULTISPECIES: urea carboxylase-associated family protein [Rhodomicrobium]
MIARIPPRSGVAFELPAGASLKVIDPMGEQVADLLAINRSDIGEMLSSGRSIDYASSLLLTTGSVLYSNRSRPMLTIMEDRVGRHDFLLTPCSMDTFRILYDDPEPPHGCHEHLAQALEPYGIAPDAIPVCFNVFMNVAMDGDTGRIDVKPPRSKAGDFTVFRAEMDLIVGLTACSAGQSNNFAFKPIDYEILGP